MQKIHVKIKPNSKVAEIDVKKDMFGETIYHVSVKNPPVEGKANKEMASLLAKHFDVPKTSVEIKSGHTSRNKIVVIDG